MPSAALASSALGSIVLGSSPELDNSDQPAVLTLTVTRDNRALTVTADRRLYVEPEDE